MQTFSSLPPHQDPSAPTGPGGPEGASETALLEREELRTDDGDADRFAHYVRKDKVTAAAVSGKPVVALCGKVWVPGRDPSKYPVCPKCKEIHAELTKSGPRWPFGRGRGSGSDS
ncbi:hypothetical protein BSZ39_04500 [Bowdeniella nasicola]|uniref:DUF3039 domain-containing protein n=1 Tax=Bowdeniella nasicola TaxID=208480 RepID=A0A1Q5Q3H6_9ACTO|nr:DUF3039 domain-containing protein [Bowdeniella nasicola]OKL54361.1 hypothetical protein BSZ39_04500 [Bowdeniella nasicola]